MPDIARRIASRTISSVWSAYSIDALYFTDGAKSGSWRTNWMRPRRTRRSVILARWPPRKITGEFSTLAHMIAPAMLAIPGPRVPMHRPGPPVIRETASAMNPALNSWCGATTDHPRASASANMCTKFGSGMPNNVLTPSASKRSRMRL